MQKHHPYLNLQDSAYWKRSISNINFSQVDPVVEFPFRINAEQRIVTAGSCFAQHLSTQLQAAGFNFLVTEKLPDFFPAKMSRDFGYGIFTARYGNIYTTRQLVQLFKRSHGQLTAKEDYWLDEEKNYIDPFRPRIQEGGFSSEEEYWADRQQHYKAVRTAFKKMDVFVFTLGLTETWLSREDGMVYPLCPGVAGGTFDAEKYKFINFGVEETTSDLLEFIDLLYGVNPGAKVILTVSPVPLIATYEPMHVLTATTYSKSVLRVSCEQVVKARSHVAYFPSYEIITGNYTQGRYFAEDLRVVKQEGVDHVMRLFMKHCTIPTAQQKATIIAQDRKSRPKEKRPKTNHIAKTEQLLEVFCDEEMLDDSYPQTNCQP